MKGGHPMSLELEDQYEKIYRYCYYKVYHPQLAEDLTQETFLKYFAQTTYIHRGKQLAYLYTIARNLCIDQLRKTPPHPLPDDLGDYNNIIPTENNLLMKHAITALSPDLQELILLRYANDLTIKEIALTVGLSRYAVHRRLNKGLSQLKKTLREEDFLCPES